MKTIPKVAFEFETIIVEPAEVEGVLVVTGDGSVTWYATPRAALKAIRREQAARGGNRIASVEWRGGLQPPEEKRR